MTPETLTPSSFADYPPEARAFAAKHLFLLQRLPLVVCPSFLEQIQNFDTLFPAERTLLAWQCTSLQTMPEGQFNALVMPLRAISLPPALRELDWIQHPAEFISELTAHLWASNQINGFRNGTNMLFAAVPAHADTTQRLVIVILGQGATVDPTRALRKLRRQGVMLTALQHGSALTELARLSQSRSASISTPYDAWYVDGGAPQPELTKCLGSGGVAVSYPALEPVRQRVLRRMQATIASGSGGAEQMRTHMLTTTVQDADAHDVTQDPVLQRFYTELFTASSGPQIFSTSFVQWTGRELARRARPQLLVLRYAPRQRQRDMNAMFAEDAPGLDPQGSLVDAEMGAYYTWLEMNRITAPGKLTFVAWVEGQPLAVLLGPSAPGGIVSSTPLSVTQAIQAFG